MSEPKLTVQDILHLPEEELDRQVRAKAVEMHNQGVISDDTYIGVLQLATKGHRRDKQQWLIWALASGSTQ